MEDLTITKKIPTLPQMTEIEHYRKLFLDAGEALLRDPSKQNARIFGKTQCDLQEIEDRYREGYQLLIERETASRGLQGV